MVAGLQFRQAVQADSPGLRELALSYWHELMPKADVMQNAERRDEYFESQFDLSDAKRPLFWLLLTEQPIGFVHLTIYKAEQRAYVEDFYIVPEARRQGHGTTMLQWLFDYLDQQNIEQIDLNVRRDNPDALAFWQAQGFGIAGYRLRQYREPATGTALIGVLSSDF